MKWKKKKKGEKKLVGIKPITPSSRMTAKEPQTDARKVRYGKPQEDSTTWK